MTPRRGHHSASPPRFQSELCDLSTQEIWRLLEEEVGVRMWLYWSRSLGVLLPLRIRCTADRSARQDVGGA